MPEPIYSKRYRKDERATDVIQFDGPGEEKRDFLREQQRRDLIFGKVVEVTNSNQCDVDIFDGSGTVFVKIYLDLPHTISELDGMLSMASMISITDAKDGHDAVLSIIYDLEAN